MLLRTTRCYIGLMSPSVKAPCATDREHDPTETSADGYDWEANGWTRTALGPTAVLWTKDVTERARQVHRMVDHSGVPLRRD